jgi:hypothetical protein
MRPQAASVGDQSPLDIMIARLALEPVVADHAALHRKPADLATLSAKIASTQEVHAARVRLVVWRRPGARRTCGGVHVWARGGHLARRRGMTSTAGSLEDDELLHAGADEPLDRARRVGRRAIVEGGVEAVGRVTACPRCPAGCGVAFAMRMPARPLRTRRHKMRGGRPIGPACGGGAGRPRATGRWQRQERADPRSGRRLAARTFMAAPDR